MATFSDAPTTIDEEARRQFESAWKQGRPRPIEEFLPPAGQGTYLPTLEELIAIELEMAWKAQKASGSDTVVTAAKPPLLETYLERFPALRDESGVLRRL